MLNSWRRLAGRKGKRSRQGGLTLEPLGERILLAAGSALPLLLGPTLAGSDGSGRSVATADQGLHRLVPVSSYYDDPFVRPTHVARMNLADFYHGNASGNPTELAGPRVQIGNEDVIFRRDATTGEFKPFAENPWPRQGTANRFGNFVFD